MVSARNPMLRIGPLKDLLVEFSTGLLSHRASAAYLAYGIDHCGLTAGGTIHLLVNRGGGWHRSGGACSDWRAVSRIPRPKVVIA